MTQQHAILERVAALPPLPTAVVDVLALMDDPDVEAGAVARVIAHDPGLTANVLRMANSSMFAGNHSVASIQEAFVRLGTKKVLSLVVCGAVAPIAQAPVEGYELASGCLWERCVAVAMAAEQFAEVLGIRAPAATFTAGLLCDIGKLALAPFVRDVADQIRRLAFDGGMSFERAECELLGLDHAEAGAALLERWQLPDEVVAAVRWHHQPEHCPEQVQQVCDLIHVADHACMSAGLGGGDDGTNYRFEIASISRTGLTQEQVEVAMCRTVTKFNELRERLCPEPVE